MKPAARSISQVPTLEAERSIITALLTKTESITKILSMLDRNDFVNVDNQLIYDLVGELYAKRKPIDIVTISAELRQHGRPHIKLDELFLNFAGDYLFHVRMLKEFTRRREVNRAIDDAKKKLAEGEDVEEVVSELTSKTVLRDENSRVRLPLLLDKVTILSLKRIERAADKGNAVVGIPTGFTDFDNEIGGLQPGEIMIVGARPGVGKSALLAGISLGAARLGHPTLIVNAEMELVEVGTRLLAGESQIPNIDLRRGRVDPNQLTRLIAASGKLAKLPVFIYDETRWEIIKTQIRALKQARKNLAIFLVDYIGRIRIKRDKEEKLYQALGRIMKDAKDLAKDLGMAGVIAAQIDRGVEKENKEPRLSDLRESGDIEQDSDIVGFLHQYDRRKFPNLVYWMIRKNRNGPLGTIKLHWVPNDVRFYDWTGD